MKYLVQTINIGGQQITGPLVGINNLGDVVNIIMQFLIPLAGIALFFVLVAGGYQFLTSQGNAEKIKSAQAKLTTGIIGFVLLIISYLAVKIIAFIFGLGGGII